MAGRVGRSRRATSVGSKNLNARLKKLKELHLRMQAMRESSPEEGQRPAELEGPVSSWDSEEESEGTPLLVRRRVLIRESNGDEEWTADLELNG